MKNIFRISILFAALTCMVACGNEELDTAQYSSSQVKLVSYGPNPVMRGGALTFIGSNLDKIVEVDVPGVDPISSIEVVKSGVQSEIRVVLPAEGPEVGKIVLKASNGKTFTTQTSLEYTEPIVLDSFSTENTPAYPGDKVTLKGDYMNLVQSVTFEGGESVAVKNIDRHNASVIIPATAITGKIILSDEGEIANLIYSEKDLQIGDPTVSSAKASAWKPNGTVTVSGKYLNMIKEINLEEGITIETESLSVSEDFKSLTFSIPSEMKSGNVTAVSYAGKEFVAGKAEMVVPSELVVSPSIIKAGGILVISGKDLDVVASVKFPNASSITDFSYENGKISVTVPLEARDGEVTLEMANDSEVSTKYNLQEPVIASVSPLELKAGETIIVRGSCLDLVKSATLGGKDVEVVSNEEGNELTITTTNTSVSGKLVLTLYNGETIDLDDEITLSYDSLIIVNEMPSAEHIGATVTLKGENFMLIENIYIGEAKVVAYTSRTDTEISFIMPWNSIGTYSMYFDLLNGDRETCPQQVEVLLEQSFIVAWEGNVDITWGDGGRVIIPASKFLDVSDGAKMRFYYTYDDDTWCQAQINYGDWSGLVFSEIGSKTLIPTCSYSGKGKIEWCTEVTLTSEILSNIETLKGDCEDVKAAGIIIQGSDITFTKVEIVQEISQEVTIWKGSAYTGANYENNLELGTEDDWTNAGIKVGSTIKIYFTAESDTDWQIQLFDGHWNGMNMLFPDQDAKNQFNATNSTTAISDGFISFKVTDEVYSVLTSKQNWGYALICQGKGITFTKFALL